LFPVPNLAERVAEFRQRVGVDPVKGGSHANFGTANYLVGLGGAAYFEIIGPDPDQPDPAQPRPLGIDSLTASRVVAWCARRPISTAP
jgi:hypothetical protein